VAVTDRHSLDALVAHEIAEFDLDQLLER